MYRHVALSLTCTIWRWNHLHSRLQYDQLLYKRNTKSINKNYKSTNGENLLITLFKCFNLFTIGSIPIYDWGASSQLNTNHSAWNDKDRTHILKLKPLYLFLQWLHQQDRTHILKLILRWEWERESWFQPKAMSVTSRWCPIMKESSTKRHAMLELLVSNDCSFV